MTGQSEEVRQRRLKALRLRAAGLSYEAVAEQCGHKSASAAAVDVRRALRDRKVFLDHEATLFRALEMERLETIQRTLETELRQAADTPQKLAVADRLLRLSARRQAVLGVDVASGAAPRPANPFDELSRRRQQRRAGEVGS